MDHTVVSFPAVCSITNVLNSVLGNQTLSNLRVNITLHEEQRIHTSNNTDIIDVVVKVSASITATYSICPQSAHYSVGAAA